MSFGVHPIVSPENHTRDDQTEELQIGGGLGAEYSFGRPRLELNLTVTQEPLTNINHTVQPAK
jgi:hypothetical protein